MKKTNKAILRYQNKIDDKPGHRIMCDTETAVFLCDLKNINDYTIGKIYLSDTGILFIEDNKNIYLPDSYKGKFEELKPPRLHHFKEGQEATKDYIGKHHPEIYMKYFDITEGV